MSFDTAFRPDRFQAALRTRLIGRFLTYRPRVDTTMVLARREVSEGAAHGTLVLAEEQTAGRGRKGRSFFSPPGENLYFTMVLRLPAELQRVLPVAAPVAVCEAIRDEGVDARIKWPNDIWIGERKVCGMLIDAESTPEGMVAFPGIGINVNGDPTVNPELVDIATSIYRELGQAVKREELLARICNGLELLLLETPESEVVRRYRSLSMIVGRHVTVTLDTGPSFDGIAEDIGADGSLLVRRDGVLETVTAADVTVRTQKG